MPGTPPPVQILVELDRDQVVRELVFHHVVEAVDPGELLEELPQQAALVEVFGLFELFVEHAPDRLGQYVGNEAGVLEALRDDPDGLAAQDRVKCEDVGMNVDAHQCASTDDVVLRGVH